jgi:hypothetical protein
MLKALVGLLLAANLLLLVWGQGWLEPWLVAPESAEREPQRLERQLRPESIVVLNPKAAAQAAKAAEEPPPSPDEGPASAPSNAASAPVGSTAASAAPSTAPTGERRNGKPPGR